MSAAIQSLSGRLEALKKIHHNQCAQLDLALETTIRDSKYSNNLMELMRREDTMKDTSSTSAKQISQKIDDSLRGETKAFFVKVAQTNSRKWDLLSEKLKREREQLKNELMGRVFGVDPTGIAMRIAANPHLERKEESRNNNNSANNRVVTTADIEKESARLEVDYYSNWFRYESHHLQEAFQSQLQRLDVEWRSHEETLLEEYETKKEAITGRHTTSVSHGVTNGNVEGEGRRWHSAEKQKTLIHTAPVFTPHLPAHSASIRPASGTIRRKDTTNAAMLADLDKVEREHQNQLQALMTQKSDAKRWLHRQQLRLLAQCEAVEAEKQHMSKVLHEELQDVQYMEELLGKIITAHRTTS